MAFVLQIQRKTKNVIQLITAHVKYHQVWKSKANHNFKKLQHTFDQLMKMAKECEEAQKKAEEKLATMKDWVRVLGMANMKLIGDK